MNLYDFVYIEHTDRKKRHDTQIKSNEEVVTHSCNRDIDRILCLFEVREKRKKKKTAEQTAAQNHMLFICSHFYLFVYLKCEGLESVHCRLRGPFIRDRLSDGETKLYTYTKNTYRNTHRFLYVESECIMPCHAIIGVTRLELNASINRTASWRINV